MSSNFFRLAAAAALALGATNAAAQACGPVELLADPAGDWSNPQSDLIGAGAGLPEQDLLGLTIAESQADGEALLTFRILTAGAPAAGVLPNAFWFASFETPEGVIYGVRLQTDSSGVASFFSYIADPAGTAATGQGPTDGRFVREGSEKPAQAGEFAADGAVTITVKAADIGIAAGQTLGPFNAASVQGGTVPGVVGFATTVDEAPDGLGRDGFYDLGSCGGKSGLLGAGGLTASLLLPLALVGLRRRMSKAAR